MTNNTVM